MKPIQDIKPEQDSNMFLFKGDPVTRKTANAGSFPKPRVIDFDGKAGSIKVAHPTKIDGLVEYYAPTEFDRFRRYFDEVVTRNPYPGCTWIFDSITSFVKMMLQYSLSFRDPAQRGKNDLNKAIGSVDIASWTEYNFESSVLDNFMSGIKTLSKTSRVILIAHTVGTDNKVEATPDGEKKVLHRPLFTAGKKPAIMLPAQMKEIYHFEIKKNMDTTKPPQYFAVTQNTDLDYASTMLPLPSRIEVTDGNLYGSMQKILKEKGIDF